MRSVPADSVVDWQPDGIKVRRRKELIVKSSCEGSSVVGQPGLEEVTHAGLAPPEAGPGPLLDVRGRGRVVGELVVAQLVAVVIVRAGLGEVQQLLGVD